MIDKPGVYTISAEEYHADPCPTPSLSSSVCKILMGETPQHAFTAHPRLNPDFKRNDDDKFDIGNSAHSLMLNDPKAFAIFGGDSWRGKDAQNFKDGARKAGKIPLIQDQWDRVVEMVERGRLQLLAHKDASNAFRDGKPEQTLIWQEGETWFRVRLDYLHDKDPKYFDDYKSTGSADPDAWGRIAFNIGHDIQAGFYRRGIRALKLCTNPHMRCIVQETTDPFALSAIEFAPEALELADRRIEQAIERWRWCMKRNRWPGYPAKTCVITPPPWHEKQLMEREERDAGIARAAGVTTSTELLAFGLEMQRPI